MPWTIRLEIWTSSRIDRGPCYSDGVGRTAAHTGAASGTRRGFHKRPWHPARCELKSNGPLRTGFAAALADDALPGEAALADHGQQIPRPQSRQVEDRSGASLRAIRAEGAFAPAEIDLGKAAVTAHDDALRACGHAGPAAGAGIDHAGVGGVGRTQRRRFSPRPSPQKVAAGCIDALSRHGVIPAADREGRRSPDTSRR